MNYGTLRVGELELPITRVRLVAGLIEFTGERLAPDDGELILPAEAVRIYGEDSKELRVERPGRITTREVARDGSWMSVTLPVQLFLSNEHEQAPSEGQPSLPAVAHGA